MIWIGIVIGIIVMQLATLIAALITNEKEDVWCIFSIFIFYPFIKLLEKIVYKIKERTRKKKLKEKQLTHQHEN